MDDFILVSSLIGFFFFALIITGLIRKYSIKNALIDVPNERSSHSIPTPRGGGLSIALSFLLVIGLLFLGGWIPTDIALALGIGGLIVAIIGWVDDHRHLPALWRTISYIIAAGWAVYCLGGLERIQLGPQALSLGYIGTFLAIFWIVWLTNLYNFMDGTDGLAGGEAICVSLFSGIVFWSTGETGLAIVCFVILMSTCGFLYWNWSPAKIFMGDVGSCLLGFVFGVLSIMGEKTGTITLAVWLILLAVFIGDATLTLLMRMIKGEKWYSAHRSHAYQRWVQMGVSHKKLALSILLINVMVLWPMAYMAYVWSEFSYYFVAVSMLLISILWGSIQVHYHYTYS